MKYASIIIIPLIVLSVIIYGYKKKINIYETFLEGAKEGLITTFNIFPAYVAMIFAISIFLRSEFLPTIFSWLEPTLANFNLPINILPMAFLRPLSGSGSLAIMNDIFASFGPDSFAGRLASTLMGCTETTFYVLALYFGSQKISKTRYAVGVGLFADLMGIIASFIVVSLMFS